MTQRGVVVLAGGVLAWLVGRLLGIAELYAVAVAAVVLVGLSVAYVRLTTSTVDARRQVLERRISAGGEVPVAVDLRNAARLPTPTLLVADARPPGLHARDHVDGTARFVVPGIRPGRQVRLPYRLHAQVRGRYAIGPLTVRVRDPFGLAERVRRYTSTGEVIVYPRIEPLADGAIRGVHVGTATSDNRRVFSTGDEFYTMREYVQGDDLRLVHWPSTAHRQSLMVRQQEQSWQAHATLFLDARAAAHRGEGPDSTLEKTVSITASLVWHLADRGYAQRLLTDAPGGRLLTESWDVLLDRLAVLPASPYPAIAPALQKTRGGEGLFVAVIGVPPGRTPPPSSPEVRALSQVRGYTQKLCLVVADRPAEPRAEATAAVLGVAGYRAVTISPHEPLPARWAELISPVRRPAASGVGRG